MSSTIADTSGESELVLPPILYWSASAARHPDASIFTPGLFIGPDETGLIWSTSDEGRVLVDRLPADARLLICDEPAAPARHARRLQEAWDGLQSILKDLDVPGLEGVRAQLRQRIGQAQDALAAARAMPGHRS